MRATASFDLHQRPVLTVTSTAIEPAWDRFVDGEPGATLYHLWRWRSVFERAFGHESHYLSASIDDRIVGILPLVELRTWLFGRFMVSLPFVNYGGVVAGDDTVAQALWNEARAISARLGLSHVELRHRLQRFPQAPSKFHKVAMMLRLGSDPGAIWSGLDRKVRNQVRKAEKSGLTCRVGGIELLDQFYPVFATNMRDLGTPVYSRRFFEQILTTFPERAAIFVVGREHVPMAAGIGLWYRDTFELPWASSLKRHRTLCPNNLLYWSAIQFAATKGCHTFDFGRSTPNEGPYQFKRQWGAEPAPLCWEYILMKNGALPDQSLKNPKFELAIGAWKHLPIQLANLLGPRVVRGIP